MTEKSLWGDLSQLPEIRTPKALLEEQAAMFNESFGPQVVASVTVDLQTTPFTVSLTLIARRLNDYRYTILDVSYEPATPYPARVYDPAATDRGEFLFQCQDEDQLTEAIQSILLSPRVRTALASLAAA